MTARLRGFTLLEMAILLAVVGLLASAALVPALGLVEDETYEEEARRMQTIRTAIFGYAARHRTRAGAEAVVSLDGGGNARTFALPGGRPFLPCPDITGNGHEDRENADETGFSAFAAAITTFTLSAPTSHSVRDFRRCESPRGALPWRTLGVPPADHWGNLYTYYVDDVFADAQTGFNENTASDIYDPRTRLTLHNTTTLTTVPETTVEDIVAGTTMTVLGVDVETGEYLYAPRDFPPLVICGGADNCLDDGGNTVFLTLVAGRQAEEGFAALFRNFAPADVVEGVLFAVVSHGENGAGAAKYEVNLAARNATAHGADGLVCSPPIFGAAGAASADLGVIAPEAFNFPFILGATAGEAMCQNPTVGGAVIPEGRMVAGFSGARGLSRFSGGAANVREFDDIVLWVNRDDLLDAMFRGGALPAPDLPALRPY